MRPRAQFLCMNKSCMDFTAQLPKVTVAIWLLHSNRPLWGRRVAPSSRTTHVIFEPAAQLISPRTPTAHHAIVTCVICIRYLCTPSPVRPRTPSPRTQASSSLHQRPCAPSPRTQASSIPSSMAEYAIAARVITRCISVCCWPFVYDIILTVFILFDLRTQSTAEHAIAVRNITMTCGYKQVKRYE